MPTTVDKRPIEHVVLVRSVLVDVGAVDVVGPDGGEGRDVAGHAAHEAGDQGGDAEAEQTRAAVADQHQRKHLVVGVLAGDFADVRGNQVVDLVVAVRVHDAQRDAGRAG